MAAAQKDWCHTVLHALKISPQTVKSKMDVTTQRSLSFPISLPASSSGVQSTTMTTKKQSMYQTERRISTPIPRTEEAQQSTVGDLEGGDVQGSRPERGESRENRERIERVWVSEGEMSRCQDLED